MAADPINLAAGAPLWSRGRSEAGQVVRSVAGWVVVLGVVLVPIILFILI